jgi:hypothetical protein
MKRGMVSNDDRTVNGAAVTRDGLLGSKGLWFAVWGSMAVVAAIIALEPRSVLSGRAGSLLSVALAVGAIVQFTTPLTFLTRKERSLTAIVCALFCVGQVEQRWTTSHSQVDFSAYYVAGGLASEKPTGQLYFQAEFPDGRIKVFPSGELNGWLGVEYRGVSASTAFLYPPLFAVFMKPFARMSFSSAYAVWTEITVICGIASLWLSLGFAERKSNLTMMIPLVVGLFSYYPFYQELQLGQTGAVILLTWALGIWLFFRHSTWRSAFFFALATMIKITPILAIPLMAFYRKWRWLIAYCCWILVLLGFSVWQVGWAAHVQFAKRLLPSISCGVPVAGNTSIISYVQELFLRYVPLLGSLPENLPPLACSISKIVAVLVYVTCIARFYLGRRELDLIRLLVLTMLISLLISPISWWHHYTIALLPFIYLWNEKRESGRELLLSISVLIIGTNIAGFAIILLNHGWFQLVAAGIVPCLTVALVYFGASGKSVERGGLESA